VPRPFAGAPVYDMSLTHAERLRAVGCGLKGQLVRLLSLGVGRHFEPQRNWRACHQMMQSIARRVASKLMAAVRAEAAKEALRLCTSGQSGAALVPLQRAIDLGDLTSRAIMAMLLINGREGVAKDEERGFQMAEEGARLGSLLCRVMLPLCYISQEIREIGKSCRDPSVPQFQKMVLVLQCQRRLLEFKSLVTALRERLGGASLPPPKEIP
jgi:hypothetical protein